MQFYCADVMVDTKHPVLGKCMKISFGGCDFRCVNCPNPEFIDFKDLQNTQEIKKELSRNINIKAVFFTGGEPGLQRQALLSIARECKRLDLKVGIETNASKPNTIKSLLREKLVDLFEISLKSPFDKDVFEKITRSKTFFRETYEIMDNVKESLSIISKSKIKTIVRTKILPELMDIKHIMQIAKIVDKYGFDWDIVYNNTVYLEDLKKTIVKEYPDINLYGSFS